MKFNINHNYFRQNVNNKNYAEIHLNTKKYKVSPDSKFAMNTDVPFFSTVTLLNDSSSSAANKLSVSF